MAGVWRAVLLLLLVSRLRAVPLLHDVVTEMDLTSEEEDTCPQGCTCNLGAVSNLVVQCWGPLEQVEDYSLLPKLQGSREQMVTALDVRDSLLPVLTDDFLSHRAYGPTLQSLRLSNSSVVKITELAFASARQLEEVDLSLNHIDLLPSELFRSNSALRLLMLRHNSRLDFPRRGAFLKSASLEELDVSFCGVTTIHAHSLARLPKLAYLNLEGNIIETIHPDAFTKLNSVEEINLSGNLLVNIPPLLPPTLQKLNLRNNLRLNVASLTELSPEMAISELDISGCNIKELPRNMFLRLNDLTHLNVSNNALTSLHFPFVLRQLLYLDLSHNALSGPVYENLLGSCSQLETLSLAWNSGLQLPSQGLLGDFSALYKLDLAGCGLETLPAISGFTGLAHLNLSNNALQLLPEDAFQSFPALSTLDLAQNQLAEIPNTILDNNAKLKYLSLASNPSLAPVLDYELLSRNELMKTLDISNCGFKDIPDKLPPNIETLIAMNNELKDPSKLTSLIEKELFSLRTVRITDNPWRCNFEFKQLISTLRERQIHDEGMGSWSDYQSYVCLTERLAEEIMEAQRPREVLRSHFWSLLSFSLTLMAFLVVAGGLTVACRGRVKGGLGRSYRHLSNSSTVCSTSEPPAERTPHKIYREPPPAIVHIKGEEKLPATTFGPQQSSLLFPRFPLVQSEIPASYVSGNYHHQELVPC